MSQKAPIVVTCPACDAEVLFRKSPYVGQYKLCSECDTELEVVSLSPIELDFVEEDDELYDEDDEFAYLDDENDADDEDFDEYELVQIEPMKRKSSNNKDDLDG